MSAAPAARPVGSAEPRSAPGAIRLLWNRTATLCLLELAKLRHDRTELYTRAVQPALWLLVFGVTFTRIHAIPTPGHLPYLDYLAPGVMAQSALFIAIFYGIQLIWSATSASSPSCWPRPRPGRRWSPARRSPPGSAPSARSWWCWSWPPSSGCGSGGSR
jgi:ABC-2 type transport system permease protein